MLRKVTKKMEIITVIQCYSIGIHVFLVVVVNFFCELLSKKQHEEVETNLSCCFFLLPNNPKSQKKKKSRRFTLYLYFFSLFYLTRPKSFLVDDYSDLKQILSEASVSFLFFDSY